MKALGIAMIITGLFIIFMASFQPNNAEVLIECASEAVEK